VLKDREWRKIYERSVKYRGTYTRHGDRGETRMTNWQL
jgi:hypothetical protein